MHTFNQNCGHCQSGGVLSGGGSSGGSAGGGDGSMGNWYTCQFCGAYHIRGEICTKFIDALRGKKPKN